jgi:hypothetical protein
MYIWLQDMSTWMMPRPNQRNMLRLLHRGLENPHVKAQARYLTKGRRKRKERAMRHYELYSWSHQYRQERLAEASRIHLEAKLRASREPREPRGLGSALQNVLASLRASPKSNDQAAGEPVK